MEHFIFRILKSSSAAIAILLLTSMMTGCNDFIATDLTDKNVSVLAPADNYTTTTATVSFFWSELDGARSYRLQIAKPSFDSMVNLLEDTLVTQTQFSYVFTPGDYEWRIRAENGSTETPWVTRSISIDSTNDLTSQQIILISPANDYATNGTSLTVNYFSLYNASSYRIAIKTHTTGFSGSLVVPEVTVTDTFASITGLTEGYFDYGVRGESGISSTPYTVRSFYVDLTDPLAPALLTPANASTIAGPNFTLTWSNATDSGSPLKDSVYIYNDALCTDIHRSFLIENVTYLTDTIGIGTYYWRVKAIDKAGNIGPFSSSRSFTVN